MKFVIYWRYFGINYQFRFLLMLSLTKNGKKYRVKKPKLLSDGALSNPVLIRQDALPWWDQTSETNMKLFFLAVVIFVAMASSAAATTSRDLFAMDFPDPITDVLNNETRVQFTLGKGIIQFSSKEFLQNTFYTGWLC